MTNKRKTNKGKSYLLHQKLFEDVGDGVAPLHWINNYIEGKAIEIFLGWSIYEFWGCKQEFILFYTVYRVYSTMYSTLTINLQYRRVDWFTTFWDFRNWTPPHLQIVSVTNTTFLWQSILDAHYQHNRRLTQRIWIRIQHHSQWSLWGGVGGQYKLEKSHGSGRWKNKMK